MTEALKPCPLCNSPARTDHSELDYDYIVYTGCTNCDAHVEVSAKLYPTWPNEGALKEEAIKQWNTRPREQELEAALREATTLISDMFEDLHQRIENKTCDGYKDTDGAYVLPMGSGTVHRLHSFQRTASALLTPPTEAE